MFAHYIILSLHYGRTMKQNISADSYLVQDTICSSLTMCTTPPALLLLPKSSFLTTPENAPGSPCESDVSELWKRGVMLGDHEVCYRPTVDMVYD